MMRLLAIGLLVLTGALIGIQVYDHFDGTPSPDSLCDTNLEGTGWNATEARVSGERTELLCERGNQTQSVVVEVPAERFEQAAKNITVGT